LKEKTVGSSIVLTGATSGIGRATAMAIADRADLLVLHGLEPERAVGNLLRSVRAVMRPETELIYLAADFGDLTVVADLVAAIRGVTGPIDLLINNAARPGPPGRTLTKDSNEVTFQANYLAQVALTSGLEALIGNGSRGRVVNVASATHLSARLRLDDLTFAGGGYSPSAVYAHAKLALVTYSCWLATHRPRPSLDVVSVHPGVISTPLLHAMFSITGDAPEHAAGNLSHVAWLHDDNGVYYDERRPAPPNPEATAPAIQESLHEVTVDLLRPWAC
jgi:NAD(P)-dependent dehydrogenase (short-subunit alcohol dehydrogenase family)